MARAHIVVALLVAVSLATPVAALASEGPGAPPAAAANGTASAPASPTAASSGGSSSSTIQLQLPDQDKLNHATASAVGYLFTDSSSPFASLVNTVIDAVTRGLYGYLTVVPRLLPGPPGQDPAPTSFENVLIPPSLFAAVWRVCFIFTLLIMGFDLVVKATREVLGTVVGEGHTGSLTADLLNLLLAAVASFLSFRAMDQIHHLINLFDNLLFLAASSIGSATPTANKQPLLDAGAGLMNGFALWKVLGFLALPMALAALAATLLMWAAEIGRLAMLLLLVATAPLGVFCYFRGWRQLSSKWTMQYGALLMAAPLSTILLILVQLLLTTVVMNTMTNVFGAPIAILQLFAVIATIGLLASANLWFYRATFGEAIAMVGEGKDTVTRLMSAAAVNDAFRWAGSALAAGGSRGGSSGSGLLPSPVGPTGPTTTGASVFPRLSAGQSASAAQRDQPATAQTRATTQMASRPAATAGAETFGGRARSVWEGTAAAPGVASRLADALSMSPSSPGLGRALGSRYGSARDTSARAANETRRQQERLTDQDARALAADQAQAERTDQRFSTDVLRSMMGKAQSAGARDVDMARTMADIAQRGQTPQQTRANFEALDDTVRSIQHDRQTRMGSDPMAGPTTADGILGALHEDNDIYTANAAPRHAGEAFRELMVGLQDIQSGRHTAQSRNAIGAAVRAQELNRGHYQLPHYLAAQRLFQDRGAPATPSHIADTAALFAELELRTARTYGWAASGEDWTSPSLAQDLNYVGEAAHDHVLRLGEEAAAGAADPVAAIQGAYRQAIEDSRSDES